MNDKKRIAAVVGPTASGKTALAVQLARHYDGEVISADSMQIYKGMDIAVAMPTADEKMGIPHHLMDFLPPEQPFSVAEYVTLANAAADDILSRGRLPILCGGTGLYVRSFLENITFAPDTPDPALREELNRRFETEGAQALLRELAEFDPECAAKLHPANRKRIVRAIEVYRSTGITMTEHIARSRNTPSPFELTAIGITFADRQKLYDRIDQRVDSMLQNGLLDEARRFFAGSAGKTSAMAIGYKELKHYLDGECSLEAAVETLKAATRHYAKRQLTWFRRDSYIHWIEADRCSSVFDEAVRIMEEGKAWIKQSS